MELQQKHIEAIQTLIDLTDNICIDTKEGECPSCPFWHYCKNSDETPTNILKNLFHKMLDK